MDVFTDSKRAFHKVAVPGQKLEGFVFAQRGQLGAQALGFVVEARGVEELAEFPAAGRQHGLEFGHGGRRFADGDFLKGHVVGLEEFHGLTARVAFCVGVNLEQGSADFEELNFEDERLVGSDGSACSTGAVGEVGRDEEFVFRAFLHQLHAFGPAGDDAVERELDGFVALVGAVELGAIEERAAIVNEHGVGGHRAFARAGSEDGVLQAAGRGFNVGFFAIFLEESLAFFECGLCHKRVVGLLGGGDWRSRCGNRARWGCVLFGGTCTNQASQKN